MAFGAIAILIAIGSWSIPYVFNGYAYTNTKNWINDSVDSAQMRKWMDGLMLMVLMLLLMVVLSERMYRFTCAFIDDDDDDEHVDVWY